MYRELYGKEQIWLSKLFDVEFKEKSILLSQISSANIICKQEYSFLSLKFSFTKEVTPYPYPVRVPVEMHAFQQSSAPIVFLLHVISGYIDELEIFTSDLTRIDVDNIKLENVEYEIAEELLV